MAKKTLPFGATPHLVVDSPAWAELSHAAVRVLDIITRQYNGRNNGHLQATYSYCKERGIGGKHTLANAIAELISHGFIYRTRSHGFESGKNTHSRYALTWQDLCDKTQRKGLFLDGFIKMAWQKWPFDENSEVLEQHHMKCQNSTFIPPNGAKTAPFRGAKTAPYELLAINTVFFEISRFDYLTAELRKNLIAGRKQGSRKILAFTLMQPKLHNLEWRH